MCLSFISLVTHMHLGALHVSLELVQTRMTKTGACSGSLKSLFDAYTV